MIRASRSRMHGKQLELYTVGKLEALVAQGVNVNAVFGGNTGPAVADGVDHTVPPIAPNHPQPGDMDFEGSPVGMPQTSYAQPMPPPIDPSLLDVDNAELDPSLDPSQPQPGDVDFEEPVPQSHPF